MMYTAHYNTKQYIIHAMENSKSHLIMKGKKERKGKDPHNIIG